MKIVLDTKAQDTRIHITGPDGATESRTDTPELYFRVARHLEQKGILPKGTTVIVAPETNAEIRNWIKTRIASMTSAQPTKFEDTLTLGPDLGLDEMDCTELLNEIEFALNTSDRFTQQFPDRKIPLSTTLGALIRAARTAVCGELKRALSRN